MNRRLRRILFGAVSLAILGYVAFLLDTTGEATLRMEGVVVDSRRDIGQMQIAMPGKTLWWEGDLPVGTKTGVYILDGRFSRYRYVWDVETSALDHFLHELEEINDRVDSSRANFSH